MVPDCKEELPNTLFHIELFSQKLMFNSDALPLYSVR